MERQKAGPREAKDGRERSRAWREVSQPLGLLVARDAGVRMCPGLGAVVGLLELGVRRF